jgi:hypothetical protein
MANTIARCIGKDRVRVKEAHRLGSESSRGEANTWRTFATCEVSADGSGYVRVQRDNIILHQFEFGPEAGDVG